MIEVNANFDNKQVDIIVENLRKQIQEAVKPVEKEVAQEILKEAKKKCPVDSGKLRDSGYVKEVNGGYSVGFGVDYAMIVHEQPQAYRENGERHFLSNAVEKVAGKNNEKIKEMIMK